MNKDQIKCRCINFDGTCDNCGKESKVRTAEEDFTSFLIDHYVVDVNQEDMFRPLLYVFVKEFKDHIAKLEARNKELEEALQKIIDFDYLPHKMAYDVMGEIEEIAEQALNKKP